MWTKQPRAASCTCDEPTKLLVVHANDFNSFLEVFPDFATMFSTAASSFAKINSVRAEQEQQRAHATEPRVLLLALPGRVASLTKTTDIASLRTSPGPGPYE